MNAHGIVCDACRGIRHSKKHPTIHSHSAAYKVLNRAVSSFPVSAFYHDNRMVIFSLAAKLWNEYGLLMQVISKNYTLT